jgi:GT2 family glycosyltransferase
MPQIAVNIVTYNSASTISVCLDTLEAQTYREFAVTVLDNASTDDTIQKLTARTGLKFICSSTNLGYAVGHNCLIAQTDSDYVLTLNPDVVLDSCYLAEIVAALAADPHLGSAAGLLLRVDNLAQMPTQIDGAGLFMRPSRRQGLRLDGAPLTERPTQPQLIFGPDGAVACYRRAMLADIAVDGEVFDVDFFMHKEDVDLCWRAQLRGWTSVLIPSAVAHHIRGFRPGQRHRVNDNLRFYGVRNRYLLMLKNEQLPHLLRDVLPILWYDLRILIYLLLFERSSLRALDSAWRLRQKMLTKRKSIQHRRIRSWRDLEKWFKI